MNKEINISCENESNLVIKVNEIDEYNFFYATISIKKDWFQAQTKFIFSYEELQNLSKQIKELLKDRKGKAEFIDDIIKVHFDIVLDEFTGSVGINGRIKKCLNDESSIKFSLMSDYYTLEQVDHSIDGIFLEYKGLGKTTDWRN